MNVNNVHFLFVVGLASCLFGEIIMDIHTFLGVLFIFFSVSSFSECED